MKRLSLLLALGLTFVFGTGASIIDKETKEEIRSINKRIDQLVEQQRQYHLQNLEQTKLLKELARRKPVIQVMAPPAPPPPKVEKEPEIEITIPPPVIPEPAMVTTKPLESTPPVVEVVSTEPPAVVEKASSSSPAQLQSTLALFFSGVSLIIMIALAVLNRRSEERLKKVLAKPEIDTLREEVSTGRPQLKVERSYDRIFLINTGSITADDIKLFVGLAAGTMKRRLGIFSKIETGKKADVSVPHQFINSQLYGTLEYTNPQNGHTYKDQFVLKADGLVSKLNTLQQAS